MIRLDTAARFCARVLPHFRHEREAVAMLAAADVDAPHFYAYALIHAARVSGWAVDCEHDPRSGMLSNPRYVRPWKTIALTRAVDAPLNGSLLLAGNQISEGPLGTRIIFELRLRRLDLLKFVVRRALGNYDILPVSRSEDRLPPARVLLALLWRELRRRPSSPPRLGTWLDLTVGTDMESWARSQELWREPPVADAGPWLRRLHED